MPEIYEEKKTAGLDFQRYLDIVRRRHLQFLSLMLLGWLVVWGASWVLPARYKSSTLILVEQPTMAKSFVEPDARDDFQYRLQSITQQMMSRTRLLTIIDELHLYAEGREHRTPDEKVELMRKDIDIELVRDPRDNQITAFRINYLAHDPRVAQQVTSGLSRLFISDNLKASQEESTDTAKFLESELENARAVLADQEAKVQEFEGQHEGELPSQQASNLQILSGLQAELQNEQDALNTAKQQRIYLQTLIDQHRALHATTAVRAADGSPTTVASIDSDLDKLKSKLADLSSRYTDQYPDVQNLKAEIARDEKTRSDMVARLKSKGKGADQPGDSPVANNIADSSENVPILQLQSQLQANQAEIANREEAVVALKGRIAGYQGRLNEEPVREQQMAALNRGYEQSKANYDDLLKKKNASEMANSMEQMQQGERFSIVDPPSLPLNPDFPNRLKFSGIGLGVGLVLGLVVVVGFELLDDRLHSQGEIKSLLGMPVISEIPEIVSPSDQRIGKRQTALGFAMAGFVVITILAGSAYSFLHK